MPNGHEGMTGLDEFLSGDDGIAGGAIMGMDDATKREKVATGMFVGFLAVGILAIIGMQIATYVKLNKKSD